MGKQTWIGPNTLLDGSGKYLKIGDGCDISADVQIYTHNTVKRCLSGGKMPAEKGGVTIGDYTYIAPMSIISGEKDIIIGAHCVIAAHSFVKESFEACSVIAGIPARKIGKVVMENGDIRLEYL